MQTRRCHIVSSPFDAILARATALEALASRMERGPQLVRVAMPYDRSATVRRCSWLDGLSTCKNVMQDEIPALVQMLPRDLVEDVLPTRLRHIGEVLIAHRSSAPGL